MWGRESMKILTSLQFVLAATNTRTRVVYGGFPMWFWVGVWVFIGLFLLACLLALIHRLRTGGSGEYTSSLSGGVYKKGDD